MIPLRCVAWIARCSIGILFDPTGRLWQVVRGEIASGATDYQCSLLARGVDRCHEYLSALRLGEKTASLVPGDDPSICAENSFIGNTDTQKTEGCDPSMFARSSLYTFLRLLEGQGLHGLFEVRYRLSPAGGVHLVGFGPAGFCLCSCLANLNIGRPCRHFFAALFSLKTHERVFRGAIIHPRWRGDAGTPWLLAALAEKACTMRQARQSDVSGSMPGEVREAAVREATKVSLAKMRAANHSDFVALGKELGKASERLHSREACRQIVAQMRGLFSHCLETEIALYTGEQDAVEDVYEGDPSAKLSTGLVFSATGRNSGARTLEASPSDRTPRSHGRSTPVCGRQRRNGEGGARLGLGATSAQDGVPQGSEYSVMVSENVEWPSEVAAPVSCVLNRGQSPPPTATDPIGAAEGVLPPIESISGAASIPLAETLINAPTVTRNPPRGTTIQLEARRCVPPAVAPMPAPIPSPSGPRDMIPPPLENLRQLHGRFFGEEAPQGVSIPPPVSNFAILSPSCERSSGVLSDAMFEAGVLGDDMGSSGRSSERASVSLSATLEEMTPRGELFAMAGYLPVHLPNGAAGSRSSRDQPFMGNIWSVPSDSHPQARFAESDWSVNDDAVGIGRKPEVSVDRGGASDTPEGLPVVPACLGAVHAGDLAPPSPLKEHRNDARCPRVASGVFAGVGGSLVPSSHARLFGPEERTPTGVHLDDARHPRGFL